MIKYLIIRFVKDLLYARLEKHYRDQLKLLAQKEGFQLYVLKGNGEKVAESNKMRKKWRLNYHLFVKILLLIISLFILFVLIKIIAIKPKVKSVYPKKRQTDLTRM